MERLTLKKYRRPGSTVEHANNSLKEISRSKKLVHENITLTPHGLTKSRREFLEFFIDDIALSELLNKLYGSTTSLLDNWVGVLGSSQNKKAEIIKIKQLLQKTVTEKEIRQVYPASWTDEEFEWHLDKVREELSDPEIIIYCCAECGDYGCNGIAILIEINENIITWTLVDDNKAINFQFDKYQYFEVLNNRLQYLQSF